MTKVPEVEIWTPTYLQARLSEIKEIELADEFQYHKSYDDLVQAFLYLVTAGKVANIHKCSDMLWKYHSNSGSSWGHA